MDMIKIRPAPGRKVRDHADPASAVVPAEGRMVSRFDPIWYRRWTDGDIECLGEDDAVVPHPEAPVPTPAEEGDRA